MEEIIFVSTVSDAKELFKQYSLNPLKKKQIIIKSPILSSDEANFWSNNLTKALNNCGCKIATIFLLTVIIVWMIGEFFIFQPKNTVFVLLIKILVIIILGLVVGKIVGVSLAKRKLSKCIRKYLTFIDRKEKPLFKEK